MRSWTPQTLYDAKPWACIVVGSVLGIGMTAWSLVAGYWTVLRGLSLFGGGVTARSVAAGLAGDLKEGVAMGAEAIDSGQAAETLAKLREFGAKHTVKN